ncbi:MAG: hypothetical protein OES25_16900 [Acidobacteriota bacterium]|nr:hypothetical protein [Acidobacteriota bacterium]
MAGTRERSKARRARLKKGVPLSTGRTTKKAPKTRSDFVGPAGAFKKALAAKRKASVKDARTIADRKRQEKELADDAGAVRRRRR